MNLQITIFAITLIFLLECARDAENFLNPQYPISEIIYKATQTVLLTLPTKPLKIQVEFDCSVFQLQLKIKGITFYFKVGKRKYP